MHTTLLPNSPIPSFLGRYWKEGLVASRAMAGNMGTIVLLEEVRIVGTKHAFRKCKPVSWGEGMPKTSCLEMSKPLQCTQGVFLCAEKADSGNYTTYFCLVGES
jgi:hypothetical protein